MLTPVRYSHNMRKSSFLIILLLLLTSSEKVIASHAEACIFSGKIVHVSKRIVFFQRIRWATIVIEDAEKIQSGLGYTNCLGYLGKEWRFQFNPKKAHLEVGNKVIVQWNHHSGENTSEDRYELLVFF